MFFVFYKKLTKRGHIRLDLLAYPDGSPMSYETFGEAQEAADDLLAKGMCITAEVRKIY
jgi:hypothetical protein